MSEQITVEETKRIPISYLRDMGHLAPGTSGQLSWTYNGEPTGTINFETSDKQLTLSYTHILRYNEQHHRSIKQTISLDSTICHFGGTRTWFICPNCNHRCGLLCFDGRYFVCRKCSGLLYYSQLKGKIDRLIDQKQKLSKQMFDESGWRKKKGMHQSTFSQYYKKYCLLEMQIDNELLTLIDESAL